MYDIAPPRPPGSAAPAPPGDVHPLLGALLLHGFLGGGLGGGRSFPGIPKPPDGGFFRQLSPAPYQPALTPSGPLGPGYGGGLPYTGPPINYGGGREFTGPPAGGREVAPPIYGGGREFNYGAHRSPRGFGGFGDYGFRPLQPHPIDALLQLLRQRQYA